MALPANPFRALLQRLPVPLQNRYYLTLVIFLFVLIFPDRNNLWTQYRLYRAQVRLKADQAYYHQKIKEAREEAEDFELTKEKHARQNYFMKQRNEDVFIIQSQNKAN